MYLGDLKLSRQVRWSQEEREELAQRVHRLRARHPDLSLVALINRAQQATQQDPWPEDRRRKILTIQQCEWLVPAMRQVDLDIRNQLEHEQSSLQQRVADLAKRPDRETLLNSLPLEEAYSRYGHQIITHYLDNCTLEYLYGYLGKRISQMLESVQRAALLPPPPSPAPAHVAVPPHREKHEVRRIILSGCQPHQLRDARKFLSHLEIVGADEPADACVVWLDHAKGAEAQRLKKRYSNGSYIEHKGAFDSLLDRVKMKFR